MIINRNLWKIEINFKIKPKWVIMERITEIIDKAAITGKKVKIICRNSYERKQSHQYAFVKGLKARSIIDYTKFYVNQRVDKTYNSQCCRDCDGFTVTFMATPFSFVEINNGNEKEIIGTSESLPAPKTMKFYGGYLSTIKRYKWEFKNRQ